VESAAFSDVNMTFLLPVGTPQSVSPAKNLSMAGVAALAAPERSTEPSMPACAAAMKNFP
jgi:hypothetical protein